MNRLLSRLLVGMIAIMLLNSCGPKYVRHWTGAQFESADRYYSSDGHEISEFEYGQEIGFYKKISYTIEDDRGGSAAYLEAYDKAIDVSPNFFDILEASIQHSFGSDEPINIIYISENIFSDLAAYESFFNDSNLGSVPDNMYMILHPRLADKHDFSGSRYPIYFDTQEVLSQYSIKNESDNMLSMQYFQFSRIGKSFVHYGESSIFYFYSPENELQYLGIDSTTLFYIEEQEVSIEQFVNSYRSTNYRLKRYLENDQEYAILVARSRVGHIDMADFLLQISTSTNTPITGHSPLCILHVEDTSNNKGLSNEYLIQDFKQAEEIFPEYRFITIKENPESFLSYSDHSTPMSTIVIDKDRVIDKFISLFEVSLCNMIVVMPDGRVKIYYGARADFIKMIEDLENTPNK